MATDMPQPGSTYIHEERKSVTEEKNKTESCG
jgi:hypothetical protein